MEGDDFTLTLHNQTHGNRLHTTCRERRTHLLPQHGRELKAYQTVQHTAGLLGIDQVHIDRTGRLDRLQNSLLGNFVEDDTLRLLNGETQHFGQVPCDGLSFAVFIGSQPHGLALGQFGQLADNLFLVGRNLVDGGKPLAYVDTQVFLRQVADVAETGAYHKVAAEKFLDGLGFGR